MAKKILKGNQFNFTKRKVKNKSFWITLVLVFAFSLSVIVVNFDNNSTLTGKSIQTISFQKANSFMYVEAKDITVINNIKVYFREDVRDNRIILEEVNEVDFSTEGVVDYMFEISSPEEFKADFEITLKLKDNINHNLYYNGNKLNLELLRKDDTYTYYQVMAGMGEFVIGELQEEPKVVQKEVQQPKKIIPEPKPFVPEPLPQPIEEKSWWDNFKSWFTS
jgi:hypothetical protein